MSGFVPVNPYTSKMTISEQDILRTLMKLRDRIVVAVLMPVLLVFVVIAVSGCSHTELRLQADREAYDVIAERNVDPRWKAADYSIEIDPRSRYFDPRDPDRLPMPQDNPASNQYMRLVDGKKGWEHWDDNGVRAELENPVWRKTLAEYVEIGADDSVNLNIDSALKLATYTRRPTRANWRRSICPPRTSRQSDSAWIHSFLEDMTPDTTTKGR